jgi:regulator of protease activity HflC (stomatin/prohibitin superfamily)
LRRVSTAALRQVYGQPGLHRRAVRAAPGDDALKRATSSVPTWPSLGIEVTDVRILRTDLDPSVSEPRPTTA